MFVLSVYVCDFWQDTADFLYITSSLGDAVSRWKTGCKWNKVHLPGPFVPQLLVTTPIHLRRKTKQEQGWDVSWGMVRFLPVKRKWARLKNLSSKE